MISIQLNGEAQQISEETSLAQLLQELKIHSPQIAIAKNLHVVLHSELADTFLENGDTIEIFHAVGGG